MSAGDIAYGWSHILLSFKKRKVIKTGELLIHKQYGRISYIFLIPHYMGAGAVFRLNFAPNRIAIT